MGRASGAKDGEIEKEANGLCSSVESRRDDVVVLAERRESDCWCPLMLRKSLRTLVKSLGNCAA